jgi:hypothetical protein
MDRIAGIAEDSRKQFSRRLQCQLHLDGLSRSYAHFAQ